MYTEATTTLRFRLYAAGRGIRLRASCLLAHPLRGRVAAVTVLALLIFLCLSKPLGVCAQSRDQPRGEDDVWREALQKAYDRLETLRKQYAKNCGGSASGSDYCKGLAKQIEEVEKAIAEFVKSRGNAHGDGGQPAASNKPGFGGIDFRDLQLTYVGEEQGQPGGLSRVFARPLACDPCEATNVPEVIRLSEESFLAGLLLPAHEFWVNLNPVEPDRIAGPELGRTDIARILLEADLRLKKDTAAITDPRSSTEARDYWQRLRDAAGLSGGGTIHQETRVWIVPGTIAIAGDEHEAYLLSAELKVQLESEHLGATATDATAPQARSELERSEAIQKAFVLPKLQERVNNAPEYRELRQVFAGLVLAAWRRQNPLAAGAFPAISSAALATRTGWTPRKTWLSYCDSFKKGEYNFTEETQETRGDLIITHTSRYFDGGVDFTHIPVPHLQPIDSETRGALRKLASGAREVTLGSRVLLSASRPLGASLLDDSPSQPAGTAANRLSRSAVFIIATILLLPLFFRRRAS